MVVDMSEDEPNRPHEAQAGGRPSDGKKGRGRPKEGPNKEELKKEASEETEKARREAMIKSMAEQGFPITDEAAINFIESYMNAYKETVAARGRPTKYDEKLGSWAEFLGAKGMSLVQIAFIFGISKETLFDWARKYPDFSDSLARARDASQSWWEMIGQASLFSDRFQSSVWNKVVSTRFRRDYTDRKGLPYDPNEPETVMGPGEMLELDPRDLTEEQKKVLRIAIAKATKQET